ncbi:MAG: Asp-tRNA(Asn)/Glu-tRNA(Gln) amidotransferase subunit GatC [Candidatus Margulisbacteria bacterium]|jgi:aspartyl-tRNA(Asn)/glutamyl-tRNA(Gln) amidotransferase subunit C|nr:Asp-tRNA(Asn)/Glu-tRNA(Gln) amidotransferase subunit GatC [Candidatus Margulisiibacteriota bacterium]
MSISSEDARHVAGLARLELTDKELRAYTEQLNQILNYARELEKLHTDNIEPTYSSLNTGTLLREDKVCNFTDQAGLLENGPEVAGSSFVVPRIL